MKVVERSIESLIPYARNPRKNDDGVDSLAASIKQFGFLQPIVIDKEGVIVAGHTRFKAAKKLGLDKVPCELADHLTPAQIKAYRILDNKLAEKSSWDGELLALELDELELDLEPYDVDFSLDPTGIENTDGPTAEVDAPESRPIAVSQVGDRWLLGQHVLYCGDSTDAETVTLAVAGVTLDMVVTDPPYGVSYVGKTEEALTIENDSLSEEETRELWADTIDAFLPHLRRGGAVYASVPGGPLNIVFAAELHRRDILRQQLIWVKDSMVLGRSDYHYRHEPILYGWKPGAAHFFTKDRTKTTALEFARPKASHEHPTMKPIALWAELISNSSKQNDTVFDPFSGSGTTIIACEQLSRRAVAIELDPRFVDVAVRRWQQFTGKTAVLESGETFAEREVSAHAE